MFANSSVLFYRGRSRVLDLLSGVLDGGVLLPQLGSMIGRGRRCSNSSRAATSILANKPSHFKELTICLKVACTKIDPPPRFSLSLLPLPSFSL